MFDHQRMVCGCGRGHAKGWVEPEPKVGGASFSPSLSPPSPFLSSAPLVGLSILTNGYIEDGYIEFFLKKKTGVFFKKTVFLDI